MAPAATRAERMVGVRANILNTAKRLFLEQGYKKTTIRQIVQESGITSGSIYNLFENKDAVFSAITNELCQVIVDEVEKRFSDKPLEYHYAAILAVELYAIEKKSVFRELYYEAYTEPKIFEALLHTHLDLADHYLAEADCMGYLKPDEYYARMLLSKGAMLGYMQAFDFDRTGPVRVLRRELASLILLSLGLKKRDIKDLYSFMLEIEDECSEIIEVILDSVHQP